jgi:hypothetical protein
MPTIMEFRHAMMVGIAMIGWGVIAAKHFANWMPDRTHSPCPTDKVGIVNAYAVG